MRKLILFLLTAAAALAITFTPQQQIQVHDLMIDLENQSWFQWYYVSPTATEQKFNEGRAVALGQASSFAYAYETSEAMVSALQYSGYMLSQLGLYETNPLTKAYLNGLAAGYNQAAANVTWFVDGL